MNILVLNCGSSSLKYQLIDVEKEIVLAKGLCERIGIVASKLTHQSKGKEKIKLELEIPNHKIAVDLVMKQLTHSKYGIIHSLDQIYAVGHRVVHGGETFSNATLITQDVIKVLEQCNELAPLHNPANLIGIQVCQTLMPNIPMVAVFDTAFHQTMDQKAYLYGIPYEYYKKYKVRRYGFHGTSHKFVAKRVSQLLNKQVEQLKIIICHLGNGASVTAVKNGISIDTSMGFTPLEGLIMGTRSGDIDPSIVQLLAAKEKKSIKTIIEILNKNSGVLGLSNNFSSDFRDLVEASQTGNSRAKDALQTYAYHVAKYIGSYLAAMNGADVIVFTAGVGENNCYTRKLICNYLDYLDTQIDYEKNEIRGEELMLSANEASIKVMVIPTNEELEIARETKEKVPLK